MAKFKPGDRVKILGSDEVGTVDRIFYGDYVVNVDKEFLRFEYDSGMRWVPSCDLVAVEE